MIILVVDTEKTSFFHFNICVLRQQADCISKTLCLNLSEIANQCSHLVTKVNKLFHVQPCLLV